MTSFFALFLLRLATISWWLFVRLTVLAVLVGGIASLSPTSMIGLGWLIEASKSLVQHFWGADYLVWVSSNWLTLGGLIIFAIVLRMNAVQQGIDTKSKENAIFLGAISSYLNITFDSPVLSSIRNWGTWSTIKAEMPRKLVEVIGFGIHHEDRYDSFPVRDGKKVSLETDIATIIKGAQDVKKND